MGALYRECSSKKGQGVEDLFNLAIELAVGGYESVTGIPGKMGGKRKVKKRMCKVL